MAIIRLFSFVIIGLIYCSCNNKESNRIISNHYLKETKSFEHTEGHAIRLWYKDSLIFISNAPNFSISVYNLEGKFIRKIGKKGPAPWEFGSIWNFELTDNNSSYWVHDYQKKMLKKYCSYTDSMLLLYKVNTKNNVQYINENRFIIPEIIQNNELQLSVVDVVKNKKINCFNLSEITGIKDSKFGHHIALHGYFAKYQNDIVYACKYAGVFYKISNSGDSISLHKYKNNLSLPNIFHSNGMVKLKPKIYCALNVTMDENSIYFLMPKNHEKNPKNCRSFYIDEYDLKTCSYKSSIVAAKRNGFVPKIIKKIPNGMIILYNDYTVSVCKYEKNAS